MGFIINVARLMGTLLPRPKRKCSLHDDRAEQLHELPIVKVTGIDCDYYDGTNIRVLH